MIGGTWRARDVGDVSEMKSTAAQRSTSSQLEVNAHAHPRPGVKDTGEQGRELRTRAGSR